MVSKKKKYRVTSQLQNGEITVTEVDEAPERGDIFEYTHTETRVGQVTKVEAI